MESILFDHPLHLSSPFPPLSRCRSSPLDPSPPSHVDLPTSRKPDPSPFPLLPLHHGPRRGFHRHKPRWICASGASGDPDRDQEEFAGRSGGNKDEDKDVEQALHLDGGIPETSDGFLKQVSSKAYDMRRQFEQSIDSSSYDVLEANPWREDSKPVYILAQEENRILTMRTRRARSEVEQELGLLFPKRGSRRGKKGLPRTHSLEKASTVAPPNDTHFRMVVEDVRDGVLVFEDEEEATRYCNLLDGEGKSCMGVAELNASDVFALCQKIKALAVLFRRGRTPPLPDRLQLNLKARKRSLEDSV